MATCGWPSTTRASNSSGPGCWRWPRRWRPAPSPMRVPRRPRCRSSREARHLFAGSNGDQRARSRTVQPTRLDRHFPAPTPESPVVDHGAAVDPADDPSVPDDHDRPGNALPASAGVGVVISDQPTLGDAIGRNSPILPSHPASKRLRGCRREHTP